ncbi:MAG TPA: hypothetical protein VFW65_23635 [Pseudonocardiaceae bacterium]|nr:hypothetical protein [Pseudonocardiaceae bacterium]
MAVDLSALTADDDFFEAWEFGDPGTRYRSRRMPPEWSSHESGPWIFWTYPDAPWREQGWKIHVASSLTNAQPVLDVVSAVCVELGVPFKHLAGRSFFCTPMRNTPIGSRVASSVRSIRVTNLGAGLCWSASRPIFPASTGPMF